MLATSTLQFHSTLRIPVKSFLCSEVFVSYIKYTYHTSCQYEYYKWQVLFRYLSFEKFSLSKFGTHIAPSYCSSIHVISRHYYFALLLCNSRVSLPFLFMAPTTLSADRIRSKFLHKIGIEAPTPTLTTQNSDALATSMNTMFEPLKIGLDSGDDSSLGSSSCDDCDSDYFFGFTEQEPDGSLPTSCTFEYFHKQPHKAEQQNMSPTSSTDPSTAITSASLKKISSQSSANSLPSLFNSSDGSSLRSSPQLSASYSSTTSNKKTKFNRKNSRKGRVSLHKSVSVIPIPSRCEYSSLVRKRIWSSNAELCANAARNTVEFASEGWNWRNVIEDEGMLLHRASGELIHPIHVENALLSQPGEDEKATLSLIAGLVPNHPQYKNIVSNPASQLQVPLGSDPITVTTTKI